MYLLLARLLKVGRRRHLILLALGLLAIVLIGGALFAATQDIPFTTGVYWAITTATTVGYGDVIPHNPSGRLIASLVMLTAIPLLGAAFAVLAGGSITAGLRRIMQLDNRFPDGTYRLVVGMHPTVPAILETLVGADDSVVLIADIDAATVPEAVHVIKGDPTDAGTLRRARCAGAQHALVTGGSDGDVLVTSVLLRKLAPDLSITALSSSTAVREALEALGIERVVSVDHLIAHTLAKSLETPHAGDLLAELVDSDEHCLVELAAPAEFVGRPLSVVRRDHGGLVLGLVHDSRVTLGIGDDPVIAAGDRLLVAEPPKALR
jgi:voltage-gated potassium channel